MTSIIRADKWQNTLGTTYNGVLQVVQTLKTDTFTSASMAQGAENDITGMTATITPFFSTSKILVVVSLTGATSQPAYANAPILSYKVYRGSTAIGLGDAAGSRNRVTNANGVFTTSTGISNAVSLIFDSPATISSTTYKVACVNSVFANSSAVFYLNRGFSDADTSESSRTSSSITLLEIAQ